VAFNSYPAIPAKLKQLEKDYDVVPFPVCSRTVGRSLHRLDQVEDGRTSGWAFAPVKIDANVPELILDNDIVLFRHSALLEDFLFGESPFYLFMEEWHARGAGHTKQAAQFMHFERYAGWKEHTMSEKDQILRSCTYGRFVPSVPQGVLINGGLIGWPRGNSWLYIDAMLAEKKIAGLFRELTGWEQVVAALMFVYLVEIGKRVQVMPTEAIPMLPFMLPDESAIGVHVSGINMHQHGKRLLDMFERLKEGHTL